MESSPLSPTKSILRSAPQSPVRHSEAAPESPSRPGKVTFIDRTGGGPIHTVHEVGIANYIEELPEPKAVGCYCAIQ